MEIKVSYEAKSVEEVLELLKAVDAVDSKAVIELQDVELKTEPKAEEETTEEEEAAEEVEESSEEETEEKVKPKAKAKGFTVEDLQALAIEANKAGKLSEIKAILKEHEVEKISTVPEELLETIGLEFSEVLA